MTISWSAKKQSSKLFCIPGFASEYLSLCVYAVLCLWMRVFQSDSMSCCFSLLSRGFEYSNIPHSSSAQAPIQRAYAEQRSTSVPNVNHLVNLDSTLVSWSSRTVCGFRLVYKAWHRLDLVTYYLFPHNMLEAGVGLLGFLPCNWRVVGSNLTSGIRQVVRL